MVTYYIRRIKICYKGEIVGIWTNDILSEEEKINFFKLITWDNLDEMTREYRPFGFYDRIYTKKGRKVILYLGNGSKKTIKEWKTPLNMSIEITYTTDFKHSLKDILENYNTDLAMKYLIEKGIKITK